MGHLVAYGECLMGNLLAYGERLTKAMGTWWRMGSAFQGDLVTVCERSRQVHATPKTEAL